MQVKKASLSAGPRTIVINDPDTGKDIRRIDWIRRVYSDANHPLFGDRAAIAQKLSDIEGREIRFQTVYSATKRLGNKYALLKQAQADREAKAVKPQTSRLRQAHMKRTTNETQIEAAIDLDGSGKAHINTGIGFFNHMLTLLAYHSRIDIKLNAKGDLDVDDHHTVEDCGLVLGMLVHEALGDKQGITRYADSLMPMDESLVSLAIDISGRPYLGFNVTFPRDKIGTFDSELIAEWFRAFTTKAGLTVHVDLVRGENSHHIAEACFKGLGRILGTALSQNTKWANTVPSSKGLL